MAMGVMHLNLKFRDSNISMSEVKRTIQLIFLEGVKKKKKNNLKLSFLAGDEYCKLCFPVGGALVLFKCIVFHIFCLPASRTFHLIIISTIITVKFWGTFSVA